jgi:hypothetical protein
MNTSDLALAQRSRAAPVAHPAATGIGWQDREFAQ